MRFDDVGLFWEDKPTPRSATRMARVMPPIPETGWQKPKDYPNLRNAKRIAVDVETYDPELTENGAGWARGVGHLVGVSLAVDGGEWYFPLRHTVQEHDNMDVSATLRWLADVLGDPGQPKIGANLLYDVGWLAQEGVSVKGALIDVQFAEALLDETAEVSLDALSQKYLGRGKVTSLLYKWCSDYYGGAENGNQRANIYRAPPSLVGHYAEADAQLPLQLAPILYERLRAESLDSLFDIECRLIPLLIAMRFAGVRVDVEKASKLRDALVVREGERQKEIDTIGGGRVDINSARSLARAFDKCGIIYGKTASGAPSFTKDYLSEIDHPLARAVLDLRRLSKLRGTFLESYILSSHRNNRLHGSFHPLRGDGLGTRSGRFSSSHPNLQNIPARDDELAPLVRGLFIPDEGHNQWRRYDYSQIEYRFLAHYAVGDGADNIRRVYNEDPATDYHEITLQLVAPEAGWDISTAELRKKHRRPIKNINFGLIYGMGIAHLSKSLGLTESEGRKLFHAYHAGAPFAKATMESSSREASLTGSITTILGRKSRFTLWQNRCNHLAPALPYEKALKEYGANVSRAYTHKALNRRLQGSAADLMKLAMLQCWESGVFDTVGVPRLTVHDELDFSDSGNCEEGFAEVKRLMEQCLPLRVPILADCDIGADWGSCL